MRSFSALILIAFFLHSASAEPADVRLDRAQITFAAMIFEPLGNAITYDLVQSGFVAPDIENIVERAITQLSQCVLNELKDNPDSPTQSFITLLSEGASREEIEATLIADDPEEGVKSSGLTVKIAMEKCVNVINQEFGLSI